MKATLEAFLQSLQKLSREQLIQKLVQMKENEIPCHRDRYPDSQTAAWPGAANGVIQNSFTNLSSYF